MKRTIMAVILVTTVLIAQASNAELSSSIGFVATNPDGTIDFLQACGDEYRLELNENAGSDVLVDFDSATTSDTEINSYNSGLYLISTEGITEADLLTYYEDRGVAEPFLSYLQLSAMNIVPYAYVQTGEWDDALGAFPVHLIDAAQKDLLGIDVPMTIPGDFPCGTYTVADLGKGMGFTLVIENPSCAEDGDGDGVSDVCDSCTDSDPNLSVDQYGCTVELPISSELEEDIFSACSEEAEWKNHGEYVRCVARAAHAFFVEGVISLEEKGAIISEAARSVIGKRNKADQKPETKHLSKKLKKSKKIRAQRSSRKK